MQVASPVGRGAGARKYDILSALTVFALSLDKVMQRRVMRLMALITTRYNWQRDELSMGQAEIARLWSVDTRTVKREMAALRAQGWLVQKRKGARGRVSVYGLDLERMLGDTRCTWSQIGPDFVERMTGTPMAPASNVVPLRPVPAPATDGSVWGTAKARLHAEDPALFAAWLHPLAQVEHTSEHLILLAPSRFHATYVETHLRDRILAVLRQIDPTLGAVLVQA